MRNKWIINIVQPIYGRNSLQEQVSVSVSKDAADSYSVDGSDVIWWLRMDVVLKSSSNKQ